MDDYENRPGDGDVYTPPAPGHSYGDGRGIEQPLDGGLYGTDEQGNPVRLDDSQAALLQQMQQQFGGLPGFTQPGQQRPQQPPVHATPPRASQAPPRPQPGQVPPANIKTKPANQAQHTAAEQAGAAATAKAAGMIKPPQRVSTMAEAIKRRQDADEANTFELEHTMPGMLAKVRFPSLVTLLTTPGLMRGQLQGWVNEMVQEGVQNPGTDSMAMVADRMNALNGGEQWAIYLEMCQATAVAGFIDPPLVADREQEGTGTMWVGRIDSRDLMAFFAAVQAHQAREAAAIAPFPEQAAPVANG